MSITLERILVPTDFSGSAARACRVAVRLARKYSAELHVLRVAAYRQAERHDPMAHHSNPDRVLATLETAALEAIEEMLADTDTDDLALQPVFRSGIAPGPSIVKYAADERMDLVVMGTHGRRGLNHLMLGSVAEEVVRSADCPVLTVRAGEGPVSDGDWDRILMPIDFSEHSGPALKTAHQLAADHDAELLLLHVVEPLQSMGISNYGHEISRNWETSQKQAAEELLDEACGGLCVEPTPSLKTVTGKPADAIPVVAEQEGAELIVIPTHGRTGLKRLLMGSVAERVVRHAPCPVLTLKAFGRGILSD